MAHFSYTAQKNDGEVYKGIVDAKDRFEVYEVVRREGGHIIGVNEDKGGSPWGFAYWNALFSTVKEYDKILFSRNLGAMLSAGLSLARALAVLERQTRNQKLSDILSTLASDVRRGDTLHVSLSKHPKVFNKLMIAMVRAGEEGGDLAPSLSVVSDQMERMYNLKKKVRGAMMYPAIILVAVIAIAILMMIYVVPTLASTFAEMDAELPRSTQVIIGISNFLTEYTILALALLIGSGGALYSALRTKAGGRATDYVLLHLPAIGQMVREINAARTARTLASLQAAGVNVLSSLEITVDVVQNSYFQEVIKTAQTSVGAGEPLSKSFVEREDLYPAFVGEMMSVGEETGQTTDMLKRLALFYEEEVDRKTKDLSTIIEPFLMVVIGAAVGFFALSMIPPLSQLSQNILLL